MLRSTMSLNVLHLLLQFVTCVYLVRGFVVIYIPVLHCYVSPKIKMYLVQGFYVRIVSNFTSCLCLFIIIIIIIIIIINFFYW